MSAIYISDKRGRTTCIIDTFVDAEGEAVVNGKLWKWEFHHYLGPTFLNVRTGAPKKYPPENHPVWKAFEMWLKGYEAAQKKQSTNRPTESGEKP